MSHALALAAACVLSTIPQLTFGEVGERPVKPPSAAELSIGDPAPPLSVAQWLRGESIGSFLPGTAYVLDFSAPWCGPCMALLPHMSTLQEKYAAHDVRVVAVFGPDSAETSVEQVERILEAAREPVRFTIAFDEHAGRDQPALDTFYGRTTAMYVEGARLDGIPAVFVIDRRGRIAWIGSPAQVASVVDQIAAGTWDADSARERYRAARAADERLPRFKADLAAGRTAAAMAEARQLVDGPYADDSQALRLIASAFATAAQAGAVGLDLRPAISAIDRAAKLTGGCDAPVLTTLARLHFLQGEVELAIEAQQRAISASQEAQRPMLQKALDEYLRAKTPARP